MLGIENMKKRSAEIAVEMTENELLISRLNSQINKLKYKQSALRQEKRNTDQLIRLWNIELKEDSE